MQEKDIIYWRDTHGNQQSMTVQEYAQNSRLRTGFYERMGLIARDYPSDVRTIPSDSKTGDATPTPGEDTGEPVCEAGGEKETQIDYTPAR